jgi:hypothetical protein
MWIEKISRENAATRHALVELVSKLSEDSYRFPIGLYWTMATTLCHLGFWDVTAVRLLEGA